MKTSKLLLIGIILSIIFIISVIVYLGITTNSEKVEIANPASTFCMEEGGTPKSVMEENGEIGYCVFEDRTCDEWEFYKGRC